MKKKNTMSVVKRPTTISTENSITMARFNQCRQCSCNLVQLVKDERVATRLTFMYGSNISESGSPIRKPNMCAQLSTHGSMPAKSSTIVTNAAMHFITAIEQCK